MLHQRGFEDTVFQLKFVDFSVVVNLNAEFFGAAVIRIDQRFATTHEKSVGSRCVQGARQGRLKAHTMFDHPRAAMVGVANGQARHVLVGEAASHFEQVLPKLFFWVGVDQHILRCIVHAAQIACVHGIATTPLKRGRLEHHDTGARFSGHQRRTQSSVATTNHQDIQTHANSNLACRDINQA